MEPGYARTQVPNVRVGLLPNIGTIRFLLELEDPFAANYMMMRWLDEAPSVVVTESLKL
jgi:hypothetical protein